MFFSFYCSVSLFLPKWAGTIQPLFSLSALLMLSPEYCFDLAYSDQLLPVLHLLSFCIHSYLNYISLHGIRESCRSFSWFHFQTKFPEENTFLHIYLLSVEWLFLFVRLLQAMTPFHFPLNIKITFFIFSSRTHFNSKFYFPIFAPSSSHTINCDLSSLTSHFCSWFKIFFMQQSTKITITAFLYQ